MAETKGPWLLAAVVAVPLASVTMAAVADDPGSTPPRAARVWAAAADDGDTGAGRRLYVTGMVGSSLAAPTVDRGGGGGDATAGLGGPALSGEGAFGVSIPQHVGVWRVEVEGRHRSAAADIATKAPAEWQTTANAWREVPLAGDVAGYVGGGVGFGGRDTGSGPRGDAVAWQAGTGLAWAWTERVTFDVGYRLQALEGHATAGTGPVGEVLFAVRIFEPFRAWRRE